VEVPVTTGPQDPASSRDRLRAGHADRDLVIEALKTAFVDGRLMRTELAGRTGRALTARTYADLAAVTADIPAESTAAEPTAAKSTAAVPGPGRAPVPPVSRPVAKAAVISGMCLAIAAAATELGAHIDPNVPGPNPHHAWVAACFSLALVAVIMAAFTVSLGAAVAIQQRLEQRRSRVAAAPAAHLPPSRPRCPLNRERAG
jgi:hypothetical protein